MKIQNRPLSSRTFTSYHIRSISISYSFKSKSIQKNVVETKILNVYLQLYLPKLLISVLDSESLLRELLYGPDASADLFSSFSLDMF